MCIVVTRAAPGADAFIVSCPAQGSKQAAKDACAAAYGDLWRTHLLLVLGNIIMYTAPILKFAYGNQPTKAKGS